MKNEVGKFSFKVPDGHPEAGKKIEKAFEYDVVENDSEAQKVVTDRKWNLVDMVNDNLKSNARSSAYQNALIPYKPVEMSQDDMKETIVRNYIRLGFSEDVARKQVDALLASGQA